MLSNTSQELLTPAASDCTTALPWIELNATSSLTQGVARYGRYEGDDKPACRADKPYPAVFLLRNELPTQELIRRYKSPEHYLDLYNRQVDSLVQARWLLPEDALRLKAKTREDAMRQFRKAVIGP
jgi:hypothetical protein